VNKKKKNTKNDLVKVGKRFRQWMNQKQYDEIVSHCELLLGNIQEQSSPEQVAQIHFYFGLAQYERHHYPESKSHLEKGLHLIPELENKDVMNAYDKLGIIVLKMGDPNKAIEHFTRALSISHQVKDQKESLKIMSHLATAQSFAGNILLSIDLTTQVRNEGLKSGYDSIIAQSSMNLVHLQLRQGSQDYEALLNLISIAIEYYKKNDDIENLANAENLKVGILYNKEDYKGGFALMKGVVKRCETINDPYRLTSAKIDLERFRFAQGEKELAIKNVKLLNTVAQKNSHKKTEQKGLELLVRFYSENNDFQNELLALRELSFLKDEIANQALQKIIARKGVEIEKLRLELETEQMEKQLNIVHNKLEKRERELTSKAMIMLERKRGLADVYKALIDLSEKEPSAGIKALRQNVKEKLNDSDEWDEFKRWFDNVNSDFFQALDQFDAKLTPQEKKVAAFIKLGLSIKEVAQLTSLSTRTIETHRLNLRKKCKLDRNQNLSVFLGNL